MLVTLVDLCVVDLWVAGFVRLVRFILFGFRA